MGNTGFIPQLFKNLCKTLNSGLSLSGFNRKKVLGSTKLNNIEKTIS